MEFENLRAAVFVTNPKDVYSGGRYYALMLTEALAELGVKTYYVTNLLPIFWGDMNSFEKHRDILVIQGFDKINSELPDHLDFSFIVPGTSSPDFYETSINASIRRGAKIVLINFESGNWFNALAENKKSNDFWSEWKKVASASSLILSISAEGSRYAKTYYKNIPDNVVFDYCYPPINSTRADAVGHMTRENRILHFARFSGRANKGSERILDILSNEYSGWTLALVVGSGVIPRDVKAAFESKARKHDVTIEWHLKISDEDKFRLYKASKILLFPSYFEGFGYPPVEARYCGCSVVAFHLPVIEETCGADVTFAKHGDWDDFGRKVATLVTTENFSISGERLAEVAPFKAMKNKLGEVLRNTCALSADYSVYKSTYKAGEQPSYKMRLLNVAELTLIYLAKKIRKSYAQRSSEVTYFPKFDTQENLANHYYRAAWYLPYKQGLLDKVNLYSYASVSLGDCPDYMAKPTAALGHLKVRQGKFAYLISLLKAEAILLWQGECESWWLRIFQLIGIRVINVDTTDLNSKEYGAYPGVIWRYLLSTEERKEIIDDSYERLCNVAIRLKQSGKSKAAVFGTAPSLESAYDYCFDDCISIICNSTVQNEDLLNHIKPTFITAGDAVSHFGVSLYADHFRRDLCKALKDSDLHYFGTATFGYILAIHYPELKDKFIFIEQKDSGPSYNFLEKFSAPKLVSTMNIHMLPLAATFADDVYVLGCDGKNPDAGKNEDFWSHAGSAQYHSLVDTGHVCHPTFDAHRQISTYTDYISSVISSLNGGEHSHGIRYTSLKESYVPGFKDRHLTPEWYVQNGVEFPVSIGELASRLDSQNGVDEKSDGRLDLPARLSVSQCYYDGEKVTIKGWFLSPYKRAELLLDFSGDKSLIFSRIKRPDIAAKFPQYNQDYVGFDFTKQVNVIEKEPKGFLSLYYKDTCLVSISVIVELTGATA